MRGPKLLVAALILLVGLLAAAGPAGAHTSVVRSEPADRTISDQPPETLTLEFVNRVDPRSVSVEVKAVDGTTVGTGERVTPDEPATSTVAFALPPLDAGTYGLAWQAIGDDGHVARGETVVGVGDPADAVLAAEVGEARFSSGDAVGRLLELAAGVARSSWYVGLSLVAGTTYVLWWSRRRAGGIGRSPTARALESSAAWWARTGWFVALAAALGGWALVLVSRVRYFDNDGSAVDGVVDALRSGPALDWAVILVAVVVTVGPLGGLRRGGGDAADVSAGASRDVLVLSAAGVVAAASSVQAGHVVLSDTPLLDLAALTAHLLAAAIWVGPLAVVSLTVVLPSWRTGDLRDRREVLTRFWSAYANVAFAAFVVLAAGGAYVAWVSLDGRWFENAYGWVLGGKVLLILAVVVPLALYHDRVVRHGARPSPGSERVARAAGRIEPDVSSPRFLGSVRLEALALVVVLGLAALLGGLDPGAAAADRGEVVATGAELFGESPPEDVAECAALQVGKRGCYREYFRSVMEAEGADVAVAEIADLSMTDAFVAADCHQITHDLGADAVAHYGDLGETLSFEASACWSGYYHGAVETELSGLDDRELMDVVPTVCADAARERYSFTHYNCVHGVGHGLMLRFDADLWTVIPYCEAYDAVDVWERRSCLGGAFMQNIVSAQEGEAATLRDDDLLYPCTALDGVYREECLGMQTSWALYELDYDYAAVFALCDTLDPTSAPACYRSMGRDISGGSLRDVGQVVAHCDLGSEAYRESCIVGAALDAVYDDHDTARATQLCDRVDERWRKACLDARDSAASTF